MIPPLWNYCRIVPVIWLFSATFPPYGIIADFISRGPRIVRKYVSSNGASPTFKGKVILLWYIIRFCKVDNEFFDQTRQKNITRLFFFLDFIVTDTDYKFHYLIYLRNFTLQSYPCPFILIRSKISEIIVEVLKDSSNIILKAQPILFVRADKNNKLRYYYSEKKNVNFKKRSKDHRSSAKRYKETIHLRNDVSNHSDEIEQVLAAFIRGLNSLDERKNGAWWLEVAGVDGREQFFPVPRPSPPVFVFPPLLSFSLTLSFPCSSLLSTPVNSRA